MATSWVSRVDSESSGTLWNFWLSPKYERHPKEALSDRLLLARGGLVGGNGAARLSVGPTGGGSSGKWRLQSEATAPKAEVPQQGQQSNAGPAGHLAQGHGSSHCQSQGVAILTREWTDDVSTPTRHHRAVATTANRGHLPLVSHFPIHPHSHRGRGPTPSPRHAWLGE